MKKERKAGVERKTKETDISLELSLDGSGRTDIQTGVPFLNHMLELFAVHGFFDLTIRATGDIDVDYHHTVEDIGICLGSAFRKALADKKSIRRYGMSVIPMDEALCRTVVDLSNRPFLYHNLTSQDRIGQFEVQLVPEFLQAFISQGAITLHVDVIRGHNLHHIVEAVFKSLGRALDAATGIDERIQGVISTKGIL